MKFFFGRKPDPVPHTSSPKGGSDAKLSYRLANLQAIGRRESQEDSFAFANALDAMAIEKKGLYAVVADGMGGMEGGKLASEIAVASLLKSFNSLDMGKDIQEQMTTAVFGASENIKARLGGKGGSTVVSVLIHDGKLYYISVGDSYLLLYRNQQLLRINRAQNVLNRDYLETIVGRNSVNPTLAKENPEKDALTQFLGMDGLAELDGFQKPLPLKAGDVILICSDGVAGYITKDQIIKSLSHGTPIDMCNALDDEIKSQHCLYQDNYTALVIQCVS